MLARELFTSALLIGLLRGPLAQAQRRGVMGVLDEDTGAHLHQGGGRAMTKPVPGSRRGLERDATMPHESGAADSAAMLQADPPPIRLTTSLASGARWSLLSLVSKQFARVGFSFLLARLLGPENFGIIGMATVYISFTGLLLDLGFGAAVIQRADLDDRDTGSVLWLNVLAAVSVTIVTVFCAPLVASFFNTPELGPVLRVLTISVLLKAIIVVPVSLLIRRLRFRAIATVEVAGTVFGGVAGVAAAMAGAEYWSLVVQTLAMDAVNIVLLIALTGMPSLRWSWASIRKLWSFSSNVMASQFLNYGHRNADNILIARFLGPASLAYYSLAYRLLLLPLQTLGEMVNRVMFPALCRLQAEPTRMRAHFLQTTQTMSFVVFPAMVGLAVAAPTLIPLMFGPDWAPAVAPTQILAGVALIQAVQLHSLVLLACGKANWDFRLTVVTFAASIIAFLAGMPWGVTGIAFGYLLMNVALWPVAISLAGRLIGLTVWGYVRVLLPALTAAGALTGAWVVIANALGGSPDWVVLAVAGTLSAVVYVSVLRMAFARDLANVLAIARLLVRPAGASRRGV